MTTKTDLGKLEASGLIQVAAVQPELEYLFRHALVQDAAYSSLLKQDRRTLHRLAAETLLTLYPDRRRELAAVIALVGILVALLSGRPALAVAQARDDRMPLANTSSNGTV